MTHPPTIPPEDTIVGLPSGAPTPAASLERTRQNYFRYLYSPDGQRYFGLGTPWVGIGIATFLCLTIVGIPGGVGHFIGMGIVRSRRRAKFREFVAKAKRCVPINTYPVLVNSRLRELPNQTAPAMVIGSFEPHLTHEFFGQLTEVIDAASRATNPTPSERAVQEILRDEQYIEGRRRLLPIDLTAGVPVFAFDLMIHGAHLPGARLNTLLIPCLAEQGDRGAIFTIPWTVVASARDRFFMTESLDGLEAATAPGSSIV